MSDITRREFIHFMSRSTAAAATLPWILECAHKAVRPVGPTLPFTPIKASTEDALVLADGFNFEVILRWRQPLNKKGELFGFNNDYIAFLPLSPLDPNEGLMWVNHEYHDPYYVSGWRPGTPRTTEQFNKERKEVGGSIVHMRKYEGRWQIVADSQFNRRLDAYTPIPLISERPILGHRVALGTMGNCAGGVTPWGTVLTCEENYENFVGEAIYKDGKRTLVDGDDYLSWTKGVKLPPEHYGWVVEVNLKSGKAKKLCALGRFAHECATCSVAPDGRVVVYSGDDAQDEHLYKFISRRKGSLEEGELYVADIKRGRWLPLNRREDERLKKAFTDHTDMMIRAREAAKIVGATPLDRPEDIEIDPLSGHIFVALTNNKKGGNYFGSILKIMEKNNNPLSLHFDSATFMAGGPETGFACPDNMVFDKKGNLWLATDISGSAMKEDPYKPFGNNGLFYVPLDGARAGVAVQVASAPNGAEFTGPCFAPDGKTLFLSVQHPGERAHFRENMRSSWPGGGTSEPAPCVVAVSGAAMESLLN